jgi:hypothetical protein
MAYAAAFSAGYRNAATSVGKIPKGARPADLPVEQPNQFEFVVNLKTAGRSGSPSHSPPWSRRRRSCTGRPGDGALERALDEMGLAGAGGVVGTDADFEDVAGVLGRDSRAAALGDRR